MKLKEILDNFGWEKVQQGQLPPEIKFQEARSFNKEVVHRWDLYALNGVYVVTEDKIVIPELSGIAKTPYGYKRTVQIPQNKVVRVDNLQEFLDGFNHLHCFSHNFLFVREEGMHFDGIGKRIEDAGELYRG